MDVRNQAEGMGTHRHPLGVPHPDTPKGSWPVHLFYRQGQKLDSPLSSNAAKWFFDFRDFRAGYMTETRVERITMKRICAWCEIAMGSADGDSDQVTHGICPECFDSMMAKVVPASESTNDRDAKAVESQR